MSRKFFTILSIINSRWYPKVFLSNGLLNVFGWQVFC